MPEAGGNGGGGQYCFEWGDPPEKWGKDFAGWTEFRQYLVDHGADPNAWIDAHPAPAQCIGATKTAPQPQPPPTPPPPVPKYCFKWGGQYWGKDFPKWTAFRKWLIDNGADPTEWIVKHPDAAKCIGAPTAPAPPPPPPPPGPPTPAPPQPPVYQADSGPWTGRGIYTTTNALLALNFRPGCIWAAVRPDMTTPDEVAQLIAGGMTVSVWEGSATPAGVAFALAHCAGYIAQAEGVDQLAAAQAQEAALGAFPKALVTNNFMTSWPAGWVAQPEAYTNEQANLTIGETVQDSLDRGAAKVVPIVGLYGGKLGDYGAARYLQDAAAIGIANLGAYEAGSVPAADIPIWAAAGTPPPNAPPPPGGAGGGGTSGAGAGPDSTGGQLSDGRRYCFKWGDSYWGKDFPGWTSFVTWLVDRGADPATWIIEHQDAAACIGAPAPLTSTDGPLDGGATQSIEGWGDLVLQLIGGKQTDAMRLALALWAQSESSGNYLASHCGNPLAASDPVVPSNQLSGLPAGWRTVLGNSALRAQTSANCSGAAAKWPNLNYAAYMYAYEFGRSVYSNIRSALKYGDMETVWIAVNESPWCKGCQGGLYPIALHSYLTGHGSKPPTPPPPSSGGGTPPPKPSGGGGTSEPPPPGTQGKAPAGTIAAWRVLMRVFGHDVPTQRSHVATLLDDPRGWLK